MKPSNPNGPPTRTLEMPASGASPADWLGRSDAALVQGAGRGIGLAIARRLLEHSASGSVFATCRNPRDARALVELAETHRGRLEVLALDLLDEATIASSAMHVAGHGGNLALVVNCAGVLHEPGGMQPERRLADVDCDAFMDSVRVNTLGPVLMAKHFGRLLRRPERAVFASLSARVGSIGDNRLGGWYAYRASKAAQNMMTRNIAIELRRRGRGIVCVALHPGTVDTTLSRPYQGGVPAAGLFSANQAAANLLAVMASLTEACNGRFFAWDGSEIPW